MAANRLSLLIERITGHPDPNTRVANLLALVLAWNTPFYPLYVVMTVGNGVSGWMPLHLVVLPAFAAVPFVSRVNSLAGRALLVLAGTLNTVVCGWLYGAAAGAQLFLLPCISLAVLLFRARERAVMVPVLACPVAGYFLSGYWGESPLGLAPLQSSHLLGINAVSVGILTGFIAWAFADRVPAAGRFRLRTFRLDVDGLPKCHPPYAYANLQKFFGSFLQKRTAFFPTMLPAAPLTRAA